MVDYFKDKPGELPGGDEPGAPRDISSWRDIYVTAKKLVAKCVHKEKEFGWARAGMSTHPRDFSPTRSLIIHRVYFLPNFSSCRLHSDWISRNRLGNWDFCVGHQLEYRSRDRRWNLQQRLSRLAPNRSALIASKFKAKDFGAETVTMVSNFEWGGPQIWYSKRYLITLEDEQFSLKTVGALLSNPCTLFVNVLCLARHYLDISADLKS